MTRLNPTGWWRLRETSGTIAYDASSGPQQHPGTYVANPTLAQPGDVDGAVHFTGTLGQYVEIPDHDALSLVKAADDFERAPDSGLVHTFGLTAAGKPWIERFSNGTYYAIATDPLQPQDGRFAQITEHGAHTWGQSLGVQRRDVDVQARFRWNRAADDGTRMVGFIARYQSDANFYHAELQQNVGGGLTYRFWKYENGVHTPLASPSAPIGTYVAGQSWYVRFQVEETDAGTALRLMAWDAAANNWSKMGDPLAGNATSSSFSNLTFQGPRSVKVRFGSNWDGGDILVTGLDAQGAPQTEIIPQRKNAVVRGSKIFQTVTSMTKSAVGTRSDKATPISYVPWYSMVHTSTALQAAGDVGIRSSNTGTYDTVVSIDDFRVQSMGMTIHARVKPDTFDFPPSTVEGDAACASQPLAVDNCYVHWLGKGEFSSLGRPTAIEYNLRMYKYFAQPDSRSERMSGYLYNLTGGLGAGAFRQNKISTDPAQVWYQIVVVYDPGDQLDDEAGVSLWRNGVLSTDPTLGSNLYANRDYLDDQTQGWYVTPGNGWAPLRIGTRDKKSYLTGSVNEVALFDRRLSASEIVDLSQATLP